MVVGKEGGVLEDPQQRDEELASPFLQPLCGAQL